MTSNGGSAGKLGFASMTAILVGSMVGAGVFNLPARFGGETGVYGALIAWTLCQMTVAGWNAGRSNVTCMRWIFTAWVIP